MNHAVRLWQRACLPVALVLLTGCASQQHKPATASETHWQGRLALKVFSKPLQAMSASFDLQGQPEHGELTLTSPLGTMLARLQWAAGSATLNANGEQKSFGSLQELARKATGTDLPVSSLFAWLQGQDESVAGWQVDLTDLPNGRLQARHIEDVQAELKIILDQ